jgi:hypothetical protein
VSLIATARALDDARFVWRVNAAAISVAQAKLAQPEGPVQWFAEYTLDHPMEKNATLTALVAVNPTIAAAVTVDSFNTVNTESVTDSDILYVVDALWDTVAARWDEKAHPAATGATTTV